jgi:hypothetical protein
MKEGLDLAISMGCSRLIAESDSMEVVAAFWGEETLCRQSGLYW